MKWWKKELVRLLVIVPMGTILLVTREVMGFEAAVMTGLTIILCNQIFNE